LYIDHVGLAGRLKYKHDGKAWKNLVNQVLPGAGWQAVMPLERTARDPGLVAAQFVKNPEPLQGHKARIYKDGRFIMPKRKCIVGVDVSKATLDYTWLPNGRNKQTSNTVRGISTLLETLKKLSPTLVVLEATGGYQNLLVETLHGAGIAVKTVNPRQVRDFARSLNRLGKTDTLDAKTLRMLFKCILPARRA